MGPVFTFWRCLFSPKLYKVYNERIANGTYEASQLERWGDQVITSLFLIWNFGFYTSPLLAYLLYRKGYFMSDGIVTLSKFAVGVGFVLAASYCVRSIGRMNSPVYMNFQNALFEAKKNLNSDSKKALKVYDFQFSDWPVEFIWSDGHSRPRHSEQRRHRSVSSILQGPCAIISYVVAHTFAVRLIYPGSIAPLTYLMSPLLLSGRTKLIKEDQGERFKLRTRDGNDIDALYIDRRNKSKNGSTLVICTEGNAGFYEIGIMVTPLELNYSVLGWNHPGFGGSSGVPYPEEEQNAVDVVLQFAIHSLGFKPQSIVLFGWSIGGYATAWAATQYPDVKAVMIDASFDDLLPLAIPRMPQVLEPIVRQTIREHLNLDVARLLCQYPGPVKLFRRSEDEIICLEPGVLSTNRGNDLLCMFLRHRYPLLIDNSSEKALAAWLAATGPRQRSVWTLYEVNDTVCQDLLQKYLNDNPLTFPSKIGSDVNSLLKAQLLLFLASKHLVDFASTHCTNLPSTLFDVPSSTWFSS